MNPIDEMKTQAAHLSSTRKALDDIVPVVLVALVENSPKEHRAAWLAETLASLIYDTLYVVTCANLEQTKFYVEAVRHALAREVIVIEDD